ncbi:MerR family DNA-binding protein [Nonomuraea africana]
MRHGGFRFAWAAGRWAAVSTVTSTTYAAHWPFRRPCPAVRERLDTRIAEIDQTIADLQALRAHPIPQAALAPPHRHDMDHTSESASAAVLLPWHARTSTAAGLTLLVRRLMQVTGWNRHFQS